MAEPVPVPLLLLLLLALLLLEAELAVWLVEPVVEPAGLEDGLELLGLPVLDDFLVDDDDLVAGRVKIPGVLA